MASNHVPHAPMRRKISPSMLIQSGGLAAMVGGVLFLAFPPLVALVCFPCYEAVVPAVAALLLVPVGMVGFHALQRDGYGRQGRRGFWLLVAGPLAVLLGGAVFFTLGKSGNFLQYSPPLVWVVLGLLGLVAGAVAMAVGTGLYGVATLQARVLPRWCGVAFIATGAGAVLALALAVLGALAFDIELSSMNVLLFLLRFMDWFQAFLLVFSMIFGLPWLASGYALWRRKETPTVRQLRRVQ